ncbi:MAG: leucine--tRNA ligase [Planctomycetes bacterium]|nr:leucine--tRNA ligase [Planctomycetota bacterium]
MSETKYEFAKIEPKWQDAWERSGIFRMEPDSDKPRHYCLTMFPYPSGTLHVGHGRNYILGDAVARYKLMKGYNLLAPMGWDAFGLPAENAAIREDVHPRTFTETNISHMKKQFQSWGVLYDWSRELATCNPEYYKWNQWLFLLLFKKGLAYRKHGPVNWCPSCETVLANEQVVEGKCERCEAEIEQKDLEQWYLKITDYAERLLDDLDQLEGWSEQAKTLQENWIGRSEGSEIQFVLEGTEDVVPVFTTRPDTVYGVTFLVLAPEHPLVAKIAGEGEHKDEIMEFVERVRAESRLERTSPDSQKEGLFLHAHVINPLTSERVQLWTANYAVMDYGTGAVMGVPAHDQRDYLFARKYKLPIKVVIQPAGQTLDPKTMIQAYEGQGMQVNSNEFTGLPNVFAMMKITQALEENEVGKATVHYRLRDWLISRQRYWGTPIPIVYCEKCGVVPVPEHQLPVLLPPNADFKQRGGQSPLAGVESFVNTSCPTCGHKARRETDTMDTFVDSSWYFLRYLSPKEDKKAFDSEEVNKWLPVDIYIGGVEHATKHLIYARFITKVLYDFMLVEFEEPFKILFNQGLIGRSSNWCDTCRSYKWDRDVKGLVQAKEEGGAATEGKGVAAVAQAEEPECASCGSPVEIRFEKMSKSKLNVVSPDELIKQYGADTERLYTLFVGPPDKEAEWSDRGVIGAHRFLYRVWETVTEHLERVKDAAERPAAGADLPDAIVDLRRKVHQTIQKVTADMEGDYKFNTSISAVMELVSEIKKIESYEAAGPAGLAALREALEAVILLLSPFTPHVTEELWEMLGHNESVLGTAWPEFDKEAVKEPTVEIAVQVNGKLRSRITIQSTLEEDELRKLVLADEKVAKVLEGKTPKDVIVVPRRLVNVVVE